MCAYIGTVAYFQFLFLEGGDVVKKSEVDVLKYVVYKIL